MDYKYELFMWSELISMKYNESVIRFRSSSFMIIKSDKSFDFDSISTGFSSTVTLFSHSCSRYSLSSWQNPATDPRTTFVTTDWGTDGQTVLGGVFVAGYGLVQFLSPESVDWLCVVVSVGGGWWWPTNQFQRGRQGPVRAPTVHSPVVRYISNYPATAGSFTKNCSVLTDHNKRRQRGSPG